MIATRVDNLTAQFKALSCWGNEKVGADVKDGPIKVTAGNEQNYFAWGRTVVRLEEQEKLYDELEYLINQMNMGAQRRGLATRHIEIHCFNPAELTREVAEQVLAEIKDTHRYTYDRIYHVMNQAYMDHSHTGLPERIGEHIWAALEEVLETLPEDHVKAVIPKVISRFFEDHRNHDISAMITRRIRSRYLDVLFGEEGNPTGTRRQVIPPVRPGGASSGARAMDTSSTGWQNPPQITHVKPAAQRSKSEEQEMTDHWLAFTRTGRHRIAGQKHTLEDIRKFTHRECESVHDYIQLLFPNSQPSQYNRTAPVLTGQMVAAIQSDRKLQRELKQSLDQMLDFWGLYRRGDQVYVDDSKLSRHQWNRPVYDHNEPRVSRVLYHLMETGFVECAKSMEAIMNRHRGKRWSKYWADAVNARPPAHHLSFNDV